jgi:hypothetical protein
MFATIPNAKRTQKHKNAPKIFSLFMKKPLGGICNTALNTG